MDLQKILVNWKTTSAGALMVIGAIVGIVYALTEKGAPTQTELMTAFTAVFAGLGLIFSRDVDKSTEETNGHKEMEDAGERINNQ